jgi:L-ascorbate metabolism protein UlaG (beta-lactamase superfamily)
MKGYKNFKMQVVYQMKIRYLGQSCFYIQTADGVRIVTDPYHSDIGLKMPRVPADILTMSHDHFDHNNVDKVSGDFYRVSEPGNYENSGIRLRGIAAFHDDEGGHKRGRNVIFRIEAEGLTLCHLGDLGHVPDESQLKLIGKIDILFIPVGEVFTFEVEDALKTVNAIKPAVVIPMHYKTKKLTIGLETEKKFLKIAGGGRRLDSSEFDVTPQTLSQYSGILVMDSEV